MERQQLLSRISDAAAKVHGELGLLKALADDFNKTNGTALCWKKAEAGTKFFSRGDNSGTHKKELDVWKNAGMEPSGEWYIVTKTFMMATLKRADAERGFS